MFFWSNKCDYLIISHQHCKQDILYKEKGYTYSQHDLENPTDKT